MRHAVDHRKLRRNPSHRKAMLRNLMNSLVRSERLVTTVARAKELRRLADRLITLGKADTLHSRRRVFQILSDKNTTDKLFAGLAARFNGRNGGYTRIMRTGYRVGDGAEMAIIEYLPAEGAAAGEKAKKAAPKKAAPKKAAPKKEKAALPKKEKAAPAKAAKAAPAGGAKRTSAVKKGD